MNAGDDHAADASAAQECDSSLPARKSISVDGLNSIGTLEYDERTGRYRATYDHGQDFPSEVIIHAVAAVSNTFPTDLEPLYSVIDPDALDSLCASLTQGRHEGDARVTFEFHGYTVALNSYGVVEVDPTTHEMASGEER
ncbi:hypothetical protein E2L06_18670 [Haloterrigena sp. H1]|uniref:HalOD1 output domain-containing protein n=1 Tax=Haloterrigena sp. H1 TaxID=2552943 RepID=UPI00110D5860|nr:HalOD1 output domain-containing protein [Haloterrigena sp. H1]TMT77987.1 hypothetical protein E2L06_20735 [Haloterrigena sp. H1]TMT80276.1 hypothetical protein E2L06_18670 [Haloterrigena sp. H1]